VGIDISRVATSALQAALEDGQQPEPKQHRRRLTAGKAILGGAALAVAAKYAVDKTSPLKRKAAMAAVRHTVRNTFGDVIPESLHDKLMDSGFFDQDDEGVGVKDLFNQSEDSESEDQDVADEGEGGEEPEGQDFFDEPEDEQGDEPEDDVDEDDEPEEDEGDEPDDEPEGDAKAGPEDDVHEDDEPHDDDGARRAKPG